MASLTGVAPAAATSGTSTGRDAKMTMKVVNAVSQCRQIHSSTPSTGPLKMNVRGLLGRAAATEPNLQLFIRERPAKLPPVRRDDRNEELIPAEQFGILRDIALVNAQIVAPIPQIGEELFCFLAQMASR